METFLDEPNNTGCRRSSIGKGWAGCRFSEGREAVLSRHLFCPAPQQAAGEGRLVWPRSDLEGGDRVLAWKRTKPTRALRDRFRFATTVAMRRLSREGVEGGLAPQLGAILL